MKKLFSVIVAIALLLVPFQTTQAWSSFRNENGQENANIIAAKTPVHEKTTGTKWQLRLVDNGPAYNSSPIITNAFIYIVNKDNLYQIDKSGTIIRTLTLTASMNSVCHMSLHNNQLFIPLSGGRIQCVDIDTMSSLWVSESFGGQSLTTTYYQNGCIYAGTTNASGTEGCYYCLLAKDGSTQWTYEDSSSPCGYYWSGAISCESARTEESIPANYVLFGGDNGIIISHSTTNDRVYDRCDLNAYNSSALSGKIRAGITYDAATDAYYTTTNNGYLYQIKMNRDGTFQSVISVFLGTMPTSGMNCTSTPTIYNHRIYVCSYNGTNGQIGVIDANTMKLIYTATAPDCHDIKSSPLICTGYACPDNSNSVYVYFTQNAFPGGIYYIEDSAITTSSEIKPLFLPEEGKQFCLSSIAADTDGTLYYSNDSGTFFAVQEGYADNTVSDRKDDNTEPQPTQSAQETTPPAENVPIPDTSVSRKPQQKSTNPGMPKRIRIRKKKYKKKKYYVTFTWKKGADTTYTKLCISGRKSLRIKGTKKRILLKKGTYTVRIYGCQSETKKSGAVKLRLRL